MARAASVARHLFGCAGVALLMVCAIPAALCGVIHDPQLTWRTVHSAHFRVHFHDGLEHAARRAAAIAEEVHGRLSPIFDWSPREPVDIVLTDETDLSNGYSQAFPANRIVLYLSPMDDGLFDFGEWLSSLITHEYVHALHLDMASAAPLQWRGLFGRQPLLFPGLYQPLWFVEGIATYYETDFQRGTGRGQSSYFEMLMRKEVEAGLKPIRQVNQTIRTWPAGTLPYLYGYYFYEFVDRHYGAHKVRELLQRYRGNLIPFMINTNSEAALGDPLDPVWAEFERYLTAKFAAQTAEVTASGIVAGERLSRHGYSTGNTRPLADGTLYYVRSDGRSPPYLMKLEVDAGRALPVVELQGDPRIDADAEHGVVLVQAERFRNARTHFDIYRFDEASARLIRLTHGARYRFVSWIHADGSLVAVDYRAGNMALVHLDKQGRLLERLWQGQAGEIISYPDVAPDGKTMVAALWRPASGWNLEQFEFASRTWQRLTNDKAIQMQPRYTPTGGAIVFSADYSGIYNIFQLSLGDGRLTRLTNVSGGAFAPGMSADNALFYTGYEAQGYDVYRLGKAAPLDVSPPLKAEASTQNDDTGELLSTAKETGYAPRHGLAPTYWTPILDNSLDRFTVGAATTGLDPLERHTYSAMAAFDFEQEQWLAGLDYAYDGWRLTPEIHFAKDFSLSRRDNELSSVRERYFLDAVVGWPFLRMRRQWLFQLGVAAEYESDSYVAPWFVSQPDQKDFLVGAVLSFNSARRYPLSISRSHGRKVELVAEDSDAFSGDYTGDVYKIDWREFVALGREHVLAARYVRGWGTESPRRFQLGGSLSSAGESALLETAGSGIALNERDYALRGYPQGLASLRGRRMQLASAEWRFPLLRSERGIMAPPMGVDQLSGTLFADYGAAWDEGSSPGPYARGFGIELHADARFFYHVPMHLRLGYASGRDAYGEEEVYLQIGSSF